MDQNGNEPMGLRIMQANVNKSMEATEATLDMALHQGVDILAVQEPWIFLPLGESSYTNSRSINHSAFYSILPPQTTLRPRTLFYISRTCPAQVNLMAQLFKDPDIMAIQVIHSSLSFTLVNIYNQEDQGDSSIWTVERQLDTFTPFGPIITVGDLNAHHSWWDPSVSSSVRASSLIAWTERNEMSLLNTPGEGTFWRPQMERMSTLDLAFVSTHLLNRIHNWKIHEQTGSDHLPISFTLRLTQLSSPNPMIQERWKTSKADWAKFSSHLQNNPTGESPCLTSSANMTQSLHLLSSSTPPPISELDEAASLLTSMIQEAASASIPTASNTYKSKPWWNQSLKEQRKQVNRAWRRARQYGLIQDYLDKRNKYFSSIKEAKRTHWNNFLETATTSSIFKAMDYTKQTKVERIPQVRLPDGSLADSFKDKCHALRTGLFPPPPFTPSPSWDGYSSSSRWEWPPLSKSELEYACTSAAKGKAPGPDGISMEMVIHAYKAIPHLFFFLYSGLFNSGYHPSCWRIATGAVLTKPKKEDYSAPKAYRVISLLNTLGKVLERLIARRLGHLAETSPLLHPTQIGGRLQKSAVDASLSLTSLIQDNRAAKMTTTTLFLDVKGAFDHVSKNRLLAVMKDQGLPLQLLSWVWTFLHSRQLRLSFNGSTEDFSHVDTGIPQGSPVSPILFLIYISPLFKELTGVAIHSYIDDIALSSWSKSPVRNICTLEREVEKLITAGRSSAVEFDLAKTELIHFSTAHQPITTSLTMPDGASIQPKEVLRWLGVWFDRKLSWNHHVSLRTDQARGVFLRMSRLANTERGLSPKAMRQLYFACVSSVSDYASVVWWKGQAKFSSLLQSLQNLALRKILGCFRTSPVYAMQLEASVAPVHVRLNSHVSSYAARVKSLPSSHPVKEILLKRARQSQFHSLPVSKSDQLSFIMSSLPSYHNTSHVEALSHFPNSPWHSLPFSLDISPLDKPAQTAAHLSSLSTLTSSHVYYTDASKGPDGSVGVGVVAWDVSANCPLTAFGLNLGPHVSVFDGEMEGVAQALSHAASSSLAGPVHVFSDSKAALFRLGKVALSAGQSTQSRAVRAASSLSSHPQLHWCPGHTDIKGNEHADFTARKAIEDYHPSNTVSITQLKSDAQSNFIPQWSASLPTNKTDSHYIQVVDVPHPRRKFTLPPAQRKALSAFFQLKLGHGYFGSYKRRINSEYHGLCSCGKYQSPSHLLLSCPLYKTERDQLKKKLDGKPFTLPILLNTDCTAAFTLSFLSSTGISTRRWLLEQGEHSSS
jgi:ribonuclease HI